MTESITAGAWEKLLEEQLTGVVDCVPVERFPENPSRYVLKHKKGVVLVRYNGRRFGDKPVGMAYQECKVSMEVVLMFKSLRCEDGLYAIMDKVQKSLFDWSPQQAIGYVNLEGDDLVGEENGVWHYGMKLYVDTYFFKERTQEEVDLLGVVHNINT